MALRFQFSSRVGGSRYDACLEAICFRDASYPKDEEAHCPHYRRDHPAKALHPQPTRVDRLASLFGPPGCSTTIRTHAVPITPRLSFKSQSSKMALHLTAQPG